MAPFGSYQTFNDIPQRFFGVFEIALKILWCVFWCAFGVFLVCLIFGVRIISLLLFSIFCIVFLAFTPARALHQRSQIPSRT